MADITTLVADIYRLFDTSEIEPTEEQLDSFCLSVRNSITNAFRHKPNEKRGLRMSSLGKPGRQAWYEYHHPEAREHLTAETKIKFLYGHILEDLLLLFARMSGHEVKEEQKELELDGIKGHKDATIDGWLCDVKSASSFGFKKFKSNSLTKENDAFGYLYQIKAYGTADNNEKLCFLAIDKQFGHLAVCIPDKKEYPDIKEKIKYLKTTLELTNPPDKCYSDEPDGVTGNRKLGVNCSYCSFKNECWSDSNDGNGLRKFIYSNGPRWLTTVKNEPKVPEDIP